MRQHIEAAESPVEVTLPLSRQSPSPISRTTPVDETDARERQRVALVRATLPPPPKGTSDWSGGIVDSVRFRLDRKRGG